MEGFFFKGSILFLVDVKSPGVGNCLFLHARGWGIEHQLKKKSQIPGGVPGGMVTARIEPCIRKFNPRN